MNVRLLAGIAFVLCSAPAPAQTDYLQCERDGAGGRTCIRAQADGNVCGYGPGMFGAAVKPPLNCNDVVVERFTAGGRLIYRRVLQGESEDVPRQVFVDDRGSATVVGTTWSSRFPVTADALQPRYSGPAPALPGQGRLGAGGDLFVTALSPAGDIVYSTFLGSPGSDEIAAIESDVRGQVDLLVRTPDLQFPVTAVPAAGGPVLVTIDIARHAVVRSQYLAAADPGRPVVYSARWTGEGTVLVVTPSSVSTYSRDGRSLARSLLKSPQFAGVPTATEDAEGDLWLTGVTSARDAQVVRLAGGTVEAFRWKLPAAGGSPEIAAPFFGPKRLVYLGGRLGFQGTLRSITENAVLHAPCRESSAAFLAVLERDGDVRMLSYFPDAPVFRLERDRTVSAAWDDLNRLTVDLDGRPTIGCVFDALRSFSTDPLGVGQLVRVRGGGFGRRTLAASPQAGRYPTRLDNLRVRIDGMDAPILAASDSEAIVSIPYGIRRNGVAPVTVQDGNDRSEEYLIQVNVLAPKLLAGVYNESGAPNSQSAPAAWGSAVSFYLTGTGPYTPSLADGQVAGPEGMRRIEAHVEAAYQVQGPAEEAGAVLYAGPVPGLFGGISRIVVRLPQARPFGHPSVVLFLKIGTVRFPLPSIWIR